MCSYTLCTYIYKFFVRKYPYIRTQGPFNRFTLEYPKSVMYASLKCRRPYKISERKLIRQILDSDWLNRQTRLLFIHKQNLQIHCVDC